MPNLTANLTTSSPQVNRASAARPKFGDAPQRPKAQTPTGDQIRLSQQQSGQATPTESMANEEVQEALRQLKEEYEQKGREVEEQTKTFLQQLTQRVQRFIKDIVKAVRRLLGKEPPKSELKQELKRFSNTAKQLSSDTELRASIKEFGQTLEESLPDSPLPADQKAEVAEFAKSLRKTSGQVQYIQQPFTLAMAQANMEADTGRLGKAITLGTQGMLHYVKTGQLMDPRQNLQEMLRQVFGQEESAPTESEEDTATDKAAEQKEEPQPESKPRKKGWFW